LADPIRELITSYRMIADANMCYKLLRDSFVGDEDMAAGAKEQRLLLRVIVA